MQDNTEKLYEIFANFQARLYNLKNYDKLTRPVTSSDEWFHSISRQIQAIPPEQSLPFLGGIIGKVEETITDLPNIFEKIKSTRTEFETKLSFYSGEELEEHVTRYATEIAKEIEIELTGYLKKLSELNKQLEDNLATFGEKSTLDKLQFDLSIQELGGFIRVLKEAGIIDKRIQNTKLKTFYLQHFSSKRGSQSASKIENALNPDEAALTKLIEIFKKLEKKAQEMLDLKLEK